MPNNLQAYRQMAEHAAMQITGSHQSWMAFLQTAARLYKYPYNEQVMIHAQRPDATACAEYDFWNQQWGRYVRRGSKGIAVIDTSGDNPKLKYVFDVSDTGTRENSRDVRLWELHQEHNDSVAAMLERNYEVSGERGLADQLERVAAQLADAYWNEHQQDMLDILEDSFLEEYDDFNVGVQFRNAATVSITYALMSRCGLEPDDYFAHEDFLSVFDFNTPETVAALGTAVSEINQQVLRQIEVTIKKYERQHSAERTNDYGRMTYSRNGDYLIPNLTLSKEPETPLGKYGRLRKTYLKEHRPVLWNRLILSEKLYPHLREIDETANRRLSQMMPELMSLNGVTESLKETDPMKWTGLMNNLKAQAEETILNELIYS